LRRLLADVIDRLGWLLVVVLHHGLLKMPPNEFARRFIEFTCIQCNSFRHRLPFDQVTQR
jgi:hypothetical protein